MKVRVLRNGKGEILATGYIDQTQPSEDNIPFDFGPVADEDGLELAEVEIPGGYLPAGEQDLDEFVREIGSRLKKSK